MLVRVCLEIKSGPISIPFLGGGFRFEYRNSRMSRTVRLRIVAWIWVMICLCMWMWIVECIGPTDCMLHLNSGGWWWWWWRWKRDAV